MFVCAESVQTLNFGFSFSCIRQIRLEFCCCLVCLFFVWWDTKWLMGSFIFVSLLSLSFRRNFRFCTDRQSVIDTKNDTFCVGYFNEKCFVKRKTRTGIIKWKREKNGEPIFWMLLFVQKNILICFFFINSIFNFFSAFLTELKKKEHTFTERTQKLAYLLLFHFFYFGFYKLTSPEPIVCCTQLLAWPPLYIKFI